MNQPFDTEISELEWCLRYADKFPDDLPTAVNFFECKFAEKATLKATTPEHFAAIENARHAANSLLVTHRIPKP